MALALQLLLSTGPADAQQPTTPNLTGSPGAQQPADIQFANIAPPSPGDTINARHVDQSNPNAKDDLTHGSAANPWKTIGFAAANLGPGQVAYVHGGAPYSELRGMPPTRQTITTGRAGTANDPIWLLEAPNEEVVIEGDGTQGGPFININQSYWIVGRFQIEAKGSPQNNNTIRVTADHVVLKNMILRGGRGPNAVLFNGAKNAALLESQISNYSFPGSESHGILVKGTSDKVLVRQNESWGNTGDSVQCQPNYMTQGNDPNTPIAGQIPTNLTIENNKYHDEGENAVDIKTCRNVTVRNNELFNFRSVPTAPQGDAIVTHYGAANLLIEDNRIHDSGRGIGLGGNYENRTASPPVVFEAGLAVVRRNLVRDSGASGPGDGLNGGGVSKLEVYHNTFYNIRGTAIKLGGGATGTEYPKSADILNNIVANAGGGVNWSPPTPSSLIPPPDYQNLFFNTPGVPPGYLQSDPYFVNPANGDFHTKPLSRARDNARQEPQAVAPITICGTKPDIGREETCPTRPPNDNLADALSINMWGKFTGDTTLATMEPGEPRPAAPPGQDCGASGIHNSVWFKLYVPRPDTGGFTEICRLDGCGWLDLSTENSMFNTVLAVYKRSSPQAPLEQVKCSNENNRPSPPIGNLAESMSTRWFYNTNYYVQLSGTGGAPSGAYDLCVRYARDGVAVPVLCRGGVIRPPVLSGTGGGSVSTLPSTGGGTNVPVPSTKASTRSYIVQPGDTLSEIAERFDIALEELVRINGIANPDLIFVGQGLRLPPTRGDVSGAAFW